MKKKIRDLTGEEVVEICSSVDCNFESCPLSFLCEVRANFVLDSIREGLLDEEVEVPEK